MKHFLTLFFIASHLLAISQGISGKVTDSANEPLPGASVALFQDDKLVTGTSTKTDGTFQLKPAPGSYILRISFVAFQTKEIPVKLTNAFEELKLAPIMLQEESSNLEEVTVEAEARLMEFQQDKRVFNVAKDLSNVGSNASEILRNIPSVDVDIDGNVSLRGSQNVRILINGKPSGLIGLNPADALRQLQGGMIERIEIITNPSARYEAEGEAGIINIILKKDDRSGLNGTFEAHTGVPHNHGGSAGLNYRSGRFNLFANLGFNYRKNPGGGSSLQEFFYPDTTYSFERDREQSRGGYDANLRLGADYNLTPTQTITGTFLYSPGLEENEAILRYRDFNGNGTLVEESMRRDMETETETTLEGDLHYEKKFDDKDHKLTADFRYQNSDDRESSDIIQSSSNADDPLYQKVENQEDEENVLFQMDYVHPYSKKRSFETGVRASFRTIINNYEVKQLQDGEYRPLSLYTNNFSYLENIYAAYAIYNDAIGDKWTYQTGLRTEYTDLSTALATESDAVVKKYFNFFPSVFLTYDINVLSDLQMSYSRRLSRPGFRSLLPFFSFSDNRNLYRGNPDLDPEFTDSYELTYIRYWEKLTLYSGAYYRHRTGVTDRIITVNDTGLTEFFPVNLAVQDAYGFEFSANWDLYKWWKAMGNVNLYRAITRGDFEGVSYNADNFSAQGRLMNRFSFWKSDLQLSFNMRAPQTTTQGKSLGIYTLDIGWSKDLWNEKATLVLNVNDVFNSRRRRSITSGDNFRNTSDFQWRSRQVTLSFTYRLNQKKSRSQKGNGSGYDGDGGDMF